MNKRGPPRFEAGPSTRGSQATLGSHLCVALSSAQDKIYSNSKKTKNHPLTGASVSGIGWDKQTEVPVGLRKPTNLQFQISTPNHREMATEVPPYKVASPGITQSHIVFRNGNYTVGQVFNLSRFRVFQQKAGWKPAPPSLPHGNHLLCLFDDLPSQRVGQGEDRLFQVAVIRDAVPAPVIPLGE